MTGFSRPALKLDFDSPELDGLIIRARRFSMRECQWLTGLDESSAAERIPAICALLAGAPLHGAGMEDVERKPVIKSWNYLAEDESGEVLPIAPDVMQNELDPGVIEAMSRAILLASMRLSPPLSRRSVNGSPSDPPMDMPMESLDTSATTGSATDQAASPTS